MDEHPANAGNPAHRHETTDADIRAIVKFAVGLFLSLVATLVVASAVALIVGRPLPFVPL